MYSTFFTTSKGTFTAGENNKVIGFAKVNHDVLDIAKSYNTVAFQVPGGVVFYGKSEANIYGSFQEGEVVLIDGLKKVVAGNYQYILVKEDEYLISGFNYYSCAGFKTQKEFNSMPKSIGNFTAVKAKVKEISCGGCHTMMITDEGLFGFGYNAYNQVGVKGKVVHTPTKLHYIDAVSVVCGLYFTIVTVANGDMYGFGGGSFLEFKEHEKLPFNNVKLYVGQYNVIIVDQNGDVYGIGKNNCGELGLPDIKLTEFKKLPFTNPTKVYSYTSCTIMIKDDEVYASGSNMLHQLGLYQVPKRGYQKYDNYCGFQKLDYEAEPSECTFHMIM